jgi:hypothetical protein
VEENKQNETDLINTEEEKVLIEEIKSEPT